jgi:acetyl-CoA carboxylase carboxyltransferase component
MHAPLATAAWPSGEFGAMGLEGAVELGYRKELDAAPAGAEREALRERLVEAQYAKGKALNMAATLEIDAVIDPAGRAAGSPTCSRREADAAVGPVHRPW